MSIIDDIEESINLLEESSFHSDLISSFEDRGWGLYLSENNIESIDDFSRVVSRGRTTSRLENNKRYIILPLIEEDRNYEYMGKVIELVMKDNRGPYFIDVDYKTEYDHEAIGVYLIDSIVLDPPFINVIFDQNHSKIKDPTRIKEFVCGNNTLGMQLHFSEIGVIRKQLMRSSKDRVKEKEKEHKWM